MKCPVCGELYDSYIYKCSQCGFEQLNRDFINRDEYELWLKEVVKPYKDNYRANRKYPKLSGDAAIKLEKIIKMLSQTLLPREEKIIRMLLGFDGEPMSPVEVAKVYDVCVNRIYQIEAKMLRKLRHYKFEY